MMILLFHKIKEKDIIGLNSLKYYLYSSLYEL